MKLTIAFGGISFIGRTISLTITPFQWRRNRTVFPRLGGGDHVSYRLGPVEIIKPNCAK